MDGWDEDDSGRTVGMDDRENENILAKIGNFCLSKMVGICEKNTIHCIMVYGCVPFAGVTRKNVGTAFLIEGGGIR